MKTSELISLIVALGALFGGLAAMITSVRPFIQKEERYESAKEERTRPDIWRWVAITIWVALTDIGLIAEIWLGVNTGIGIPIAMVGTLLVALAAMILARLIIVQKGKDTDPSEENHMKRRTIILIIVSSVCLVAGAGLGISWAAPGEPLNVQLTKAAWDAYNAKKYDQAVEKANECIKEFDGQALIEQEKLEKEKAPQPPEGNASKEETDSIHKRGPLNDVATCYFVKGRALEDSRHYTEARAAFEKSTKLTYARTWDLGGWFWSPAKAAEGRLKTLPKDSNDNKSDLAPKPADSKTKTGQVDAAKTKSLSALNDLGGRKPPIWGTENITESRAQVIVYESSVMVKPKFYSGPMPLKLKEGKKSIDGNHMTVVYQDFGEFRNVFVYKSLSREFTGIPDGARTVDRAGNLLAEAKVLDLVPEEGKGLTGIQVDEFHYDSTGNLLFRCRSTFDYPLGMKQKETEIAGTKQKDYYFIWPLGGI